MTRVTLEGLVKRHDRATVIDGASLEIRPAEMLTVLGPPGSGKTTLARLVSGLDRLDDGEIYFDARMIHTLPPEERRVGLVFQDDSLWPRHSVAENVEYPLRVHRIGRRERRRRVDEVLSLVGIDSLSGKGLDGLSALQRRRVELARALAIEPELLILDEPSERLDPRDQSEFRDGVRRIQAESRVTTLVLTRDPREAITWGDRLAVLNLGRIVQVGTPGEVYNHPASTFVARLLGATNLMQGSIDGNDSHGEVVVRTPLGRLIGHASAGTPSEGAAVTVSIRPEALTLGPTVPIGSNRFAATVERLVFRGEVREVFLQGPNDWPVVALTLQSQSHALREGQNLTVSVSPEQVVVLPEAFEVPN
jgi:ABC-type Fe3+/spermidine/putrescine transport system ATPase subunit